MYTYCTVVDLRFGTDESKATFLKTFKKQEKKSDIRENEEEATTASRILTTIEAKTHKTRLQKKLDSIFDEECSEDKGVIFN